MSEEQAANPQPNQPPADLPDLQGPEAPSDEFDSANASLANALSLSFTVLRVIMVVLIVVFLFSGFFTVEQNEVAVRTQFGRIIPDSTGSEVLTADGGPYFRWPAPIGQVYRIPTQPRLLNIENAFVVQMARLKPGAPLSELYEEGALNPEVDSSLLTADKNIVHARYRVTYQVNPKEAATFVRNIAAVRELDRGEDNPHLIFADADEIVRNAVEQAIVADVAATPLDRFLQGGRSMEVAQSAAAEPAPGEAPEAGSDTDAAAQAEAEVAPDTPAVPAEGEQGSLEAPAGPAATGAPAGVGQNRIREKAQDTLRKLNSGIIILEVVRTEDSVPSSVRPMVTEVNTAVQQKGTLISEAYTQSRSMFTDAAGSGYPAVLAVIDVYEQAGRVQQVNPEFFAAAERAVREVYEGQPLGAVLNRLIQVMPEDDPQLPRLRALAEAHADTRLGGRADSIVREATADAARYLSQLESNAREFESLLATYRDRPELVRQSLFNKTMRNIFASETIETEFVAPGSRLRIDVNRDPERQREEEQRSRERRGAAGQ